MQASGARQRNGTFASAHANGAISSRPPRQPTRAFRQRRTILRPLAEPLDAMAVPLDSSQPLDDERRPSLQNRSRIPVAVRRILRRVNIERRLSRFGGKLRSPLVNHVGELTTSTSSMIAGKMNTRTVLLVNDTIVHASIEFWKGNQVGVGAHAHDLIHQADRPRFQRALYKTGQEGHARFLFRCNEAQRRWIGYLEALSDSGRNGTTSRRTIMWTWEAVPQECEMLSPRQRQVLLGLLRGLTPRQIADHIGISANTVRTHLARCQLAVGCGDQSQLIRWAEANRVSLTLLAHSSRSPFP